MVKITKLINFLMVFIHDYIQFWTRTQIRIRNLELWIRIRQKVSDPCGSGSSTLLIRVFTNTKIILNKFSTGNKNIESHSDLKRSFGSTTMPSQNYLITSYRYR
jgi:hypothetical protein